MPNFISIFTFAKKHNTSPQNIYRMIREGKIKPEDYRKEQIKLERLRINEETEIFLRK